MLHVIGRVARTRRQQVAGSSSSSSRRRRAAAASIAWLESRSNLTTIRTYFRGLGGFGGGGGDGGSGDDDNSNKNNGGDSPSDGGGGSDSSGGSSGGSSGSSGSGDPASTVMVPTRMAFGDQAPRFPHMQGLPLSLRPLFPGFLTSVTLQDEDTINALEALQQQQASQGPAFIGCFLRKDSSASHQGGGQAAASVSEGGVIVPPTIPEVITDASELHDVGTFAQIQRLARGSNFKPDSSQLQQNESDSDSNNDDDDDPTATLILLGHRRVDLLSVDEIGPPVDVTVKHWSRMDYAGTDDTIRALSNEILNTIREVAQLNPLFRENLTFLPMRVDANDPFRLADFAASISASGSPEDLQSVLEEKDPEARLHKALVLLSREREVSKLQQEISQKVEEKMSETQRKYFLNEQLKSIKKELGIEQDDKEALMRKYRAKLAGYPEPPPAEAAETIEAELEKFAALEKNSPEYNVTRSYLDWLTGIPWGVVTEENFDIQKARVVLDKDHYGLDDVKDTILQFIAIGKLKGTVQGKILCLAGPPGTGKTSIAKSVAESLGRKFYRFSVGGLSDVSEIKGHRRTYIGAMPGKIIQCLKSMETSNPVVLIDEIDKLGTGFRGDPASALLEVLDPSQNVAFRDHFLDVPVDISKVLFMCTANELERIPGPLLDRMEVIMLSGYDFPEKVAIAEQYLVPRSMHDSGLMVEREKQKQQQQEEEKKDEDEVARDDTAASDAKKGTTEQQDDGELKNQRPLDMYVHADGVPKSLTITEDAISSIVRWYAREAGVRNLAKYVDKICRKLALQVVAETEGATLTEKSARKSDSWSVTADNLNEYIGKPVFTSDRLYEDGPLPEGIVMGLAYTSMGGSALYVETQGIMRGLDSDGKPRGGGSIKVTGQLGDVMKESTQIAYTVARARLTAIDPSNDYFDTTDIHTHVPEGSTPKDGPSAGVTMVTSMLSLALNRPIRNDLAMTGEISLTGKVLPVGGVKEKIMAARRAGIKCVVLPAANQRDYDEIPDYLKDGLDVHYADDYDKVFDVAFDNDNDNGDDGNPQSSSSSS